MAGLTCLHCGAAGTNGTVLCKRCVTTVQVALENVASYHAELFSLGGEPTRIRRPVGVADPTGDAAGRLETPPADAADIAAADTRTMLVGWVRILLDERDQLDAPRDTVKCLTAFLTRHVHTIATLEWAGEVARDTLAVEQRLRRIIERSKGGWYAGICSAELEPERPHDGHTCLCACHTEAGQRCSIDGGCSPEQTAIDGVYCERDLYAQPGSAYVRCPACGAQWRLAERRDILLNEARDTLLPVSVIATAVVPLLDGEPSVQRLTRRLKQWVQRGTLDDYGVRYVAGRPVRVYRMGDVLDTLTREASRVRGS